MHISNVFAWFTFQKTNLSYTRFLRIPLATTLAIKAINKGPFMYKHTHVRAHVDI